MEISEKWPDIYDEGYVQYFQAELTQKFTSNSRSTKYKDNIPPTEYLSNDLEDRPNQHEKSHELCDETWHSISSLMENQWELREPDYENFRMEEGPL